MLFILLIVFFLVMGILLAQDQEATLPKLTGPYLGQKPPGMTAEIFAPGIFPKNQALGCSGFLNNGTVFVYSCMKTNSDWRLKPTYVTELQNGTWTKSRIAPFSAFSPYNFTVGPDDQTIYFTTLLSPDKTKRMFLEQANIWVVKLEINGWTDPIMLGKSINTDKYYENYPAVTNDGTIYYMSRREGEAGKSNIHRSRNLDGLYAEAENLSDISNIKESAADPFVAPDESYLILCQKKADGYGEYDLYISFKQKEDFWGKPINMGKEVNSSAYEFRPYVTPDGKYLFFTSNRLNPDAGDIFWVSAGVIEKLKPDNLR